MPSPRALRVVSPYLLAALMLAAGVNHFVHPEVYDRIMPRALPAPRALTYASGVAEVACAAALAVPRARRAGGWATAALLVAVFPANVQMALDGGVEGSTSWLGSGTAAWLRLPLQAPLVLWALHVAGRVGSGRSDNSGERIAVRR